MKNYRYYFAVLACAALALAGCNKEPGFTTGKDVRFGAATMAEPLTKTTYGDIKTETVSGEEKRTHQMIDWQAGDVIRIACAQASTTESGTSTSADYKTSSGTKNGTESRATLSLASSNDKGLRWGSTEVAHTFYGVYPSPVTTGKSGDALTVDGDLTGSIPESQTPSSVSGTTDFVASPDMTNQYLVAKRTVAAGKQSFGDDEVFLYFTPITTAIEFEVTNAMTEDLAIGSIELLSTNCNLSGGFTTSLTGLTETGASYSNYPAVTAASGAKKNAAVSFGTSGLTLGANKKLTFTIFLLPESNLNDLTFRINKVGGGYIQTALKRDASTWLSFDRCKKHFVKGLLANEGAKWTMGLTSSVMAWESGLDSPVPMLDMNNYTFTLNDASDIVNMLFANTSADKAEPFNIKSYCTDPDNSATKIPVGFDVSYTLDGGANWYEFDAAASSSAINGLYGLAKSIDVTSSDNVEYKLYAQGRDDVDPGSHSYWTGSNGDWSPADWSNTNAKSTAPLNLSLYDFETDEIETYLATASTANCYIIRHAGTYKFPLVYGNGQSSGQDYWQSYYPGKNSGMTGTQVLSQFKDYAGNNISTPIIDANNLKDVQKYQKIHGHEYGWVHDYYEPKATSCEVLWQDGNIISNVELTLPQSQNFSWNNYVYTFGENVGGKPYRINGTTYSEGIRYIKFTVSQNTIQQGNAVIALKDDEGKIMWTWHIWVTNDPAIGQGPVEMTNVAGNKNKILNMPSLGVVEESLYKGRGDVQLKFTQKYSGKELKLYVKQRDVIGEYSTLFYQHGRKDPFTTNTAPSASATDIATAIKNPTTLYGSSTGSWYNGQCVNFWTGRYGIAGASVEKNTTMNKTIYDPSPVNYMVPVLNVFSALADVVGPYQEGYYFKQSEYDYNGIFFGAGYLWSSVPESSSAGGSLVVSDTAPILTRPTDVPLSKPCAVRPMRQND